MKPPAPPPMCRSDIVSFFRDNKPMQSVDARAIVPYPEDMISRRDFGMLATGLMVPRRLIANRRSPRPIAPSDRKFLFLFNDGGWDPGFAFTPLWHVADAYMEAEAASGTANGISFVDHPERPSVREFFETWGDQAALINGVEVQSVTHERCRELFLTGYGALQDDWAGVLAGNSSTSLLLPHIVIDGPAYTNEFTSGVVRVGDAGQLTSLLSGEALDNPEILGGLLSADAEALADAFVAQRARATPGDFGAGYLQALDRIDALLGWDDLNLDIAGLSCERDIVVDCGLAFDLFSQGLSRCAMLRYKGWCAEGWDTHQRLEKQSRNFDDLFGYINAALSDLSTRTGLTGNPLADEVTIVVFSEMGREPRLNAWGGRDHWTFTSTVLIGSGIRGGQVIGGLDEYGQGQSVDLETGAIATGGTALLPEHLGATLLTLGDVDPAAYIDGAHAIDAVML
jgi:hypothetical protein